MCHRSRLLLQTSRAAVSPSAQPAHHSANRLRLQTVRGAHATWSRRMQTSLRRWMCRLAACVPRSQHGRTALPMIARWAACGTACAAVATTAALWLRGQFEWLARRVAQLTHLGKRRPPAAAPRNPCGRCVRPPGEGCPLPRVPKDRPRLHSVTMSALEHPTRCISLLYGLPRSRSQFT